jgi:hypothetical protein
MAEMEEASSSKMNAVGTDSWEFGGDENKVRRTLAEDLSSAGDRESGMYVRL